MTQPLEPEADIQGWYYRTANSEAVRVRLSTNAGSILLHTLSGRLVASWAPGRLETRSTDVIGERWTVGDQRLPEAFLVLESDKDYAAVRKVSAGLWPTRARLWRLLGFAAVESGNRRGWPVLLLLIVAVIVALQYFI